MKLAVLLADDQLSEKILEKTIGLCQAFAKAPEITLIHVINARAIAEDVEVGADVEGNLAFDAEKLIAEKGAVLEKAAISYKTAILNGFPAKEVNRYAKEKELDMIIMGHHDLSLVQKVTIGSIANKVVQQAECPVLLIK
ncbi:universal stress protein [Listeria booriae]|uniref:universal stress protein n=1 Tax=Listeria booriae TaxID=1552123 RepID=UPI00162ADDCC|nr:universal stress protein [Listeria booriae]MBC1291382.1 universal stress protein [Listeria booriae]MBC6130237.1 universal stress protein [Listeria booriae]MBC6164171.1 universal stress protein [Listeria booriae]